MPVLQQNVANQLQYRREIRPNTSSGNVQTQQRPNTSSSTIDRQQTRNKSVAFISIQNVREICEKRDAPLMSWLTMVLCRFVWIFWVLLKGRVLISMFYSYSPLKFFVFNYFFICFSEFKFNTNLYIAWVVWAFRYIFRFLALYHSWLSYWNPHLILSWDDLTWP